MSYDIYIGEGVLDVPSPEDAAAGDNRLRIVVRPHTHLDAPHFPNDVLTKQGNSRHPGYSQWARACEDMGLSALFFDKERGLMRNHPGAFLLTWEHHAEVAAALDRHMTLHPDTVPGFQEWDFRGHQPVGPEYDAIKARLIWLEWWMRWALENCKVPAIYNF